MTDQTYRRVFGTLFGAALGFTFVVMSQVVNPLSLPGITFHQPPLGMWGNLMAAMAIGGLAGLLVAWADSAFISIVVAAMMMGLGVELVGTLYGTWIPPEDVGPVILSIIVLWLPMTGLLGALFFVLRWIMGKQVELRRDHAPFFRRAVMPGLALIIIGGLGATSILSAEGQQRIQEMDALLKTGLHTSASSDLPPALSRVANQFRERATPRYSLQFVKGDGLLPWRIAQPAGYQAWEFSIVAARFENNWVLACLFVPRTADPLCRSYDRDPTIKGPPEP